MKRFLLYFVPVAFSASILIFGCVKQDMKRAVAATISHNANTQLSPMNAGDITISFFESSDEETVPAYLSLFSPQFSASFLSDHNVNNLTVQYQIAKFGQSFVTSYYFTSSHDINDEFTGNVLMPEDWQIRAEVTDNSTDNKYYSNALEMTVLYPDADSIKSNSDVLDAVDAAWQQTKSAANTNSIYEFGTGIYVVSAVVGSSAV